MQFSDKEVKPQPNHFWCKKSSSQELTDEKDVKSNWVTINGLLLLHDDFDNDDKAAKCSERKKHFVALSSLSKILISSTAGGLGHPIRFTSFSSWPL